MQPSEYWRMTPKEVFLIIDSNTPPEMVGNLTLEEVERLDELNKQLGNK